jgi:hypothetical protein
VFEHYTSYEVVAICHWQRCRADFTSDFIFSLDSRNVCVCAIFKHHLCVAKHRLTLTIQIIFVKFNILVQINFFTISLIFKIQNQSLCGRRFVKTNKIHYKITCRFELGTVPGTAVCTAEFNSTLSLQMLGNY